MTASAEPAGLVSPGAAAAEASDLFGVGGLDSHGAAGAPASGGAPVSGGAPAAAATAAAEGSVAAEVARARGAAAALRAMALGEATRPELVGDLGAMRLWATELIQAHTDAEGEGGTGPLDDEEQLMELFGLVEEINALLEPAEEWTGAGAPEAVSSPLASSPQAPAASAAAVPPPPSAAPPDRAQQELYDAILAQYLQEREDEEFRMLSQAHEADDAALAWRLSMGLAEEPEEHPVAAVVYCARCRRPNELQGGGGRGVRLRFVCHSCGLMQEHRQNPHPNREHPRFAPPTRRPPASGMDTFQSDVRPQRHAPPARVIKAPEAAPELFVGGPAEEEELDVRPAPHKGDRGTSASASAARRSAGGSIFGTTAGDSSPMVGGGASNSESLLGSSGYSSSSSKKWAKSTLSSVAAGLGGKSAAANARRLGDGTPLAEYTELDDWDTQVPLCGTGAPASSASKRWLPKGSFLRTSHARTGEADEPLIDRVRVNEEWEHIRPPSGQPYWHNSATGASQWEPPDCVTRGRAS